MPDYNARANTGSCLRYLPVPVAPAHRTQTTHLLAGTRHVHTLRILHTYASHHAFVARLHFAAFTHYPFLPHPPSRDATCRLRSFVVRYFPSAAHFARRPSRQDARRVCGLPLRTLPGYILQHATHFLPASYATIRTCPAAAGCRTHTLPSAVATQHAAVSASTQRNIRVPVSTAPRCCAFKC